MDSKFVDEFENTFQLKQEPDGGTVLVTKDYWTPQLMIHVFERHLAPEDVSRLRNAFYRHGWAGLVYYLTRLYGLMVPQTPDMSPLALYAAQLVRQSLHYDEPGYETPSTLYRFVRHWSDRARNADDVVREAQTLRVITGYDYNRPVSRWDVQNKFNETKMAQLQSASRVQPPRELKDFPYSVPKTQVSSGTLQLPPAPEPLPYPPHSPFFPIVEDYITGPPPLPNAVMPQLPEQLPVDFPPALPSQMPPPLPPALPSQMPSPLPPALLRMDDFMFDNEEDESDFEDDE